MIPVFQEIDNRALFDTDPASTSTPDLRKNGSLLPLRWQLGAIRLLTVNTNSIANNNADRLVTGGRPMKLKKEDRVSHMILFCALMMVKNSSATVQQSMRLVPASGNGRDLAKQLGKPLVSVETN